MRFRTNRYEPGRTSLTTVVKPAWCKRGDGGLSSEDVEKTDSSTRCLVTELLYCIYHTVYRNNMNRTEGRSSSWLGPDVGFQDDETTFGFESGEEDGKGRGLTLPPPVLTWTLPNLWAAPRGLTPARACGGGGGRSTWRSPYSQRRGNVFGCFSVGGRTLSLRLVGCPELTGSLCSV